MTDDTARIALKKALTVVLHMEDDRALRIREGRIDHDDRQRDIDQRLNEFADFMTTAIRVQAIKEDVKLAGHLENSIRVINERLDHLEMILGHHSEKDRVQLPKVFSKVESVMKNLDDPTRLPIDVEEKTDP